MTHLSNTTAAATALVAAAVFLLIAAAPAVANGTMTVLVEGKGSGTVTSGNQNGEFKGSPKIECIRHGKTESTSGVCKNELSLEGLFEATFLTETPKYGSEFGGWTVVVGGIFISGCEPGEETCAPIAFEGENPAFEVIAVFEPCAVGSKAKTCQGPTLTLSIVGSGAGEVVSADGKPRIECSYVSPGPQTGVCQNKMVVETEGEGGEARGHEILEAISGPGSKFKGWKILKGEGLGGEGFELFCGPSLEKAKCLFFLLEPELLEGRNMKVTAEFKTNSPGLPLTLTTSGAGSGSFKCKDLTAGGKEEACVPKYPENDEVAVTAIPGEGSVFAEFNAENGGECSGATCVVKMTAGGRKVNAKFNLKTFKLTLNAGAHGSLAVECNGGGAGSCAPETAIPYGTKVKVTATPEAIYTLKSLSGTGSASGHCEVGTKTCTFKIEANSEVSAAFTPEIPIFTPETKVWGEVPQTTTLETTCPKEVYLGKFIPNLQHNETYAKTCGLTVTATGMKNVLTAADKTGEAVGRLGHLVQPSYSLAQPLETMATDTEGLGGTSGTGGKLAPLTSPVTLLTYGTPVNDDAVLLEFSQPIKQHDPLHTGIYSKTITLTLEQTEP